MLYQINITAAFSAIGTELTIIIPPYKFFLFVSEMLYTHKLNSARDEITLEILDTASQVFHSSSKTYLIELMDSSLMSCAT